MNLQRIIIVSASIAVMVSTASGQSDHFVQDRFAIGLWFDPPADEQMDKHYADIADAHFSMVIGGFGARTPEAVKRQLQLCAKYDLKAIVSMAGLKPEELLTGPACWGYLVRDEPSADDFPEMQSYVEAIRKARPGHLAYINLFPNYAKPQQLATDTYEEHVRRFIAEVDVDVLSMDHYPTMTPKADTREAYCENLESMRTASLEADIPFWNFFNTMPFARHHDPTEAQIRWQIFTSLAYGAKGVMYFCYWTPPSPRFEKNGAIITREGRKTRHYDQARRINSAVRNLGPTLMKLTSTAVIRVRPEDDPEPLFLLACSPIRVLTPDDYLVGIFRHEDGRQAVLLNNYRFAYTAWPTVEFDADPSAVVEVCQETGQEIPLRDDSPAIEGVQLSLDAGAGRLFLLPTGSNF